jgi:hypothetical protein
MGSDGFPPQVALKVGYVGDTHMTLCTEVTTVRFVLCASFLFSLLCNMFIQGKFDAVG